MFPEKVFIPNLDLDFVPEGFELVPDTGIKAGEVADFFPNFGKLGEIGFVEF